MDEGNAHGGEASPGVSVVVATMNRSHLLQRMHTALATQLDAPDWELVVVNDASTDATASVLAEIAADDPRVRVINLTANRGPAGARNVGWRAAAGDIVLFTDDDCVTAPTWMRAMSDELADGADVVQGPISADPERVADVGVFGRTIDRINDLNPFFATCNLGCRRTWLEKLDGFDESFPHPWCEDVDLGQRAAAAGARIGFAPQARVVHDVVPGTWWGYVRDRRRRISDALLVDKHPHMRARLGDLDRHAPALTAAAGLALMAAPLPRPLRWVVGPLLVAVYARRHGRREAPPGVGAAAWYLAGPGTWASDTIEALRYAWKRAELRLRRRPPADG